MPQSCQSKVLVIDDDAVQLTVVRAWLESDGYEVVTHDSPFGTARLVARERPDFLILDISMPALDSHRLADMLQREGKTQGVGIIFYSSQRRPQLDALAALAKEHGVLGAIPKTERGRAFLVEFRCLADRWMQQR